MRETGVSNFEKLAGNYYYRVEINYNSYYKQHKILYYKEGYE